MKQINQGDRVAFQDHKNRCHAGTVRKACHNWFHGTWYWIDKDPTYEWEQDKDLLYYVSESRIIR